MKPNYRDPMSQYASAPRSRGKVFTEQEDKENKERKKAECILQRNICSWINDTWPETDYVADFAAGLFLPIWIAEERAKQAPVDKVLDLTILEPRGEFHGLIIEIKTLQGDPYLKDGLTVSKGEHLQAQDKVIQKLLKKGYYATFGVGEEHIKGIVNWYKKLPQGWD